MLKPKGTDPVASPDGIEPGMEEILRSIRGILGEETGPEVSFPEPDALANDELPPPQRKGPPLAFLQRKRPPETVEPVADIEPAHAAPAPKIPTLEERLERHRAKAEAERTALRALAERAAAKTPSEEAASAEPVADVVEPVPPAQTAPVAELDIFAESEDLTDAPTPTARPRARRMELPEIAAEPIDYSGVPKVEVLQPVAQQTDVEQSLDGTFEDIARSMLMEKAGDMDGVLADMMRPLVREWLDDNLSSIVERVVREEIERVSRGGR